MRRITSKRDQRKKAKRNQLILGIFLIIVMMFSILGYGFLGREDTGTSTVTYNDYEFESQGGLWFVDIDNIRFGFMYNPNQVPKIDGPVAHYSVYFQEPLYIFSEDSSAESEVYVNLGQVALRVQRACFEGETCEDETLPVKTCEDNFIIIRESESSNIIQDNNCVFIEGKSEDLVKVTDEFLFKTLGVE